VKFNGTQGEFVRKFGLDPTDISPTPTPAPTPTPTNPGTSDVNIHLVCPHCGKQIF